MDNLSGGLANLDQIKHTLIDMAILYGPKVLAAVLIMAVGVFAARWTGKMLRRALKNLELEPPMRILFERIVRIVVVLLFAMMALQNLGVELLPLIAGLGVAGAGIALAMQGVLSNVVAGLTIIFTKPYRVGEFIHVVGVEGQVVTISLFSTTLLHPDRSLVVVPNRKVVGEILQNFGRIRQAEICMGIAYGSDVRAALALIRDLVTSNTKVLSDPLPVIQAQLLADSAIQISIRPWVAVADFVTIPGELNIALHEKMRERGFTIPFPQREVRILNAAA